MLKSGRIVDKQGRSEALLERTPMSPDVGNFFYCDGMLLLFDILLIGDCPTFSIPRTTAVADRVHGIEKSRHHKKHPFSSDYLNITGGARIDRLLSLLQGVPLLQRLVLSKTIR